MLRIKVIGESHSQLFDNIPQYKRGLWNSQVLLDKFDVKYIGPLTLYRICRDGFNSIEEIKNIKNGDTCMLSFGEIDIRCHIIKQSQIQGIKVEDIIDEMCEMLKKRFLDFNYNLYNFHVLSVLPPIEKYKCIGPNPEFPFIGTDKERSDATIYLNMKLEKICKQLNVGYFNQYDLYVDVNGFLDYEKSDYIVHAIKTLDLENYTIKYFSL